MAPRTRRRVVSARRQSAYRRFFATGEQLEPRQMLYAVPVQSSWSTDGQSFEPMKACSYCDLIAWVGNAWAAASDYVGSFEGQAGDLNLDARSSRNFLGYNGSLPAYSTREQRAGVASAQVKSPSSGTTWTTLEVETTFDSVTGSTKYIDTSGLAADAQFQVADLVDVTGLASGRYPFHMDFVGNRSTTGTDVFDFDGHILVAGPSDSLLSAGWRIPIDRLSFDAEGALWETAAGALYWFDEDSGDYTTPAGELSGATLVEDTGVFTITDRWHNQTIFDAAGLLTEKIDRDGNSTLYVYTVPLAITLAA